MSEEEYQPGVEHDAKVDAPPGHDPYHAYHNIEYGKSQSVNKKNCFEEVPVLVKKDKYKSAARPILVIRILFW